MRSKLSRLEAADPREPAAAAAMQQRALDVLIAHVGPIGDSGTSVGKHALTDRVRAARLQERAPPPAASVPGRRELDGTPCEGDLVHGAEPTHTPDERAAVMRRAILRARLAVTRFSR